MSRQQSPGVARHDFYDMYSAYMDGFLEQRSVLSASLFPEKPAQMYFGYCWVQRAAPGMTACLARHRTPAELGELFRSLRSEANALSVTSCVWMYLMGTLGRELTGAHWPKAEASEVLTFWQGVYEAYTTWCEPASRPPERGSGYARFRVVDDTGVAALSDAVTPSGGDGARAALAACANYSWLLECESRQGTFSHGLYEGKDGLRLLVREFVGLSAPHYPWVDDSTQLPGAPIAIVLALRDVEARFDAFGVAALEPAAYEDHVTGIAVVTEDGVEPDPGAWLAQLATRTTTAHRALFRTIAKWSSRERFSAGARSYARIWADMLDRAGASRAEIDELVFGSLDAFAGECLDEHLARAEPAPIWPWVARRERASVFAPVLGALAAEPPRAS